MVIPAVMLVQAEAQSLITFTTTEAQAMLDAFTLLNQQQAQQIEQDSDERRGLAVSLINNTIKPQLVTPSGDYLTQHSQILSNIRFLEDEIKTAQNFEMADELRKLLNSELADFDQLRRNHAQGIIT